MRYAALYMGAELQHSAMNNPTTRFTGKTDNYKSYRPSYPPEVITYIESIVKPTADVRIADLGSGTGILTELLLKAGYNVAAAEPNAEMREAAEEHLKQYPNFTSIAAPAEHTTLADNSINLITVAQAFHWFDLNRIKDEFERILKPNGAALLIWSIMRLDTPFMQPYKAFRKQYEEPVQRPLYADKEAISLFFDKQVCTEEIFPHSYTLDEDGLKGLLLSSSLVKSDNDAMLAELKVLFNTYAVDGKVAMQYDAKVYRVQY